MRNVVVVSVLIIVVIGFFPAKADQECDGYFPVQAPLKFHRNIYFQYAETTANWLKAMAEENGNDGLRWPVSKNQLNYFRDSMESGAAGIGYFFLEMYVVTGDESYLAYAKGAGNYLLGINYTVSQIDWLSGAAGIGDFLVHLWEVTGDSRYLAKAGETGDWLISQHREENGGYFWKHGENFTKVYTSYAHGAAGIGYFFSRLYDSTGKSQYLEVSQKVDIWLTSYRWNPGAGQYTWPRLTTDTFPNTTWCGGSMGILLYYLQMYDSTGDEYYLNTAVGGANGLIAHADSAAEGEYRWARSPGEASFPVVYCHGTSSVAKLLFDMYRRTGNTQYLDYARGGALWLRNQTHILNDLVYDWRSAPASGVVNGLLTGGAGVGYAFTEFYDYDPSPSYLEYARGAAHGLMGNAAFPTSDQTCWLTYEGSSYSSSEAPEYKTGWYDGAAGIGLFFLRLSQTLPAPVPGNLPPNVNLDPHLKIHTDKPLEFYVDARDPDNDPLVFIGVNLPKGAELSGNRFAWTPETDQIGTFDVQLVVTDGVHEVRKTVAIEVYRKKKSKITR